MPRTLTGFNLDAFPAPTRAGAPLVYLEGCEAWDALEHEPCPACLGRKLGRAYYCLRCDRFGLDGLEAAGLVYYPGLPKGAAMNADYPASTVTVYRPAPGLRGGIDVGSRRANRRRRVA